MVAITDDGHCVQNNELMRRALEYAKMFDLPVMDHCQDYSLVTDGVMHEGYWSTALGLRGWPAAGEEMIVARNILLAETDRRARALPAPERGRQRRACCARPRNAACRFPAKPVRIISR